MDRQDLIYRCTKIYLIFYGLQTQLLNLFSSYICWIIMHPGSTQML